MKFFAVHCWSIGFLMKKLRHFSTSQQENRVKWFLKRIPLRQKWGTDWQNEQLRNSKMACTVGGFSSYWESNNPICWWKKIQLPKLNKNPYKGIKMAFSIVDSWYSPQAWEQKKLVLSPGANIPGVTVIMNRLVFLKCSLFSWSGLWNSNTMRQLYSRWYDSSFAKRKRNFRSGKCSFCKQNFYNPPHFTAVQLIFCGITVFC